MLAAADCHRGGRPRLATGRRAEPVALRARPRRWAYGAYFDGRRRPDRARRDAPARATATSASRRCPAASPTSASCANSPRGDQRALVRARHRRRSRAARPLAPRATMVSPVTVLGPAGGRRIGRPGCPGLLLAGDAAGFVDPMTGDGLRFALQRRRAGGARRRSRELASGVPAWRRPGRPPRPRVRRQVAPQPGAPRRRRLAAARSAPPPPWRGCGRAPSNT